MVNGLGKAGVCIMAIIMEFFQLFQKLSSFLKNRKGGVSCEVGERFNLNGKNPLSTQKQYNFWVDFQFYWMEKCSTSLISYWKSVGDQIKYNLKEKNKKKRKRKNT